MKNKLLFAIVMLLLQTTLSFSQITNTTNQATGSSEYVGWNGLGGNNKDLDIQNKFGNFNINFLTNNGTSTTQKMTILGNNSSSDGFIGLK